MDTRRAQIIDCPYFDVYAAYLLPEPHAIDFPSSYSLINTFPLILNEIVDADYPLKDNRLIEVEDGWMEPFKQRGCNGRVLAQLVFSNQTLGKSPCEGIFVHCKGRHVDRHLPQPSLIPRSRFRQSNHRRFSSPSSWALVATFRLWKAWLLSLFRITARGRHDADDDVEVENLDQDRA